MSHGKGYVVNGKFIGDDTNVHLLNPVEDVTCEKNIKRKELNIDYCDILKRF